jgi:cation transport ATPase
MLHDMGHEVMMLTGDNQQTAEYFAKELHFDQIFAEVLPDEKAEKVKEVQGQGKLVAIPLAAGVLFTWGIVLSPAVGAVLMPASTIIVAVNARLLKLD